MPDNKGLNDLRDRVARYREKRKERSKGTIGEILVAGVLAVGVLYIGSHVGNPINSLLGNKYRDGKSKIQVIVSKIDDVVNNPLTDIRMQTINGVIRNITGYDQHGENDRTNLSSSGDFTFDKFYTDGFETSIEYSTEHGLVYTNEDCGTTCHTRKVRVDNSGTPELVEKAYICLPAGDYLFEHKCSDECDNENFGSLHLGEWTEHEINNSDIGKKVSIDTDDTLKTVNTSEYSFEIIKEQAIMHHLDLGNGMSVKDVIKLDNFEGCDYIKLGKYTDKFIEISIVENVQVYHTPELNDCGYSCMTIHKIKGNEGSDLS